MPAPIEPVIRKPFHFRSILKRSDLAIDSLGLLLQGESLAWARLSCRRSRRVPEVGLSRHLSMLSTSVKGSPPWSALQSQASAVVGFRRAEIVRRAARPSRGPSILRRVRHAGYLALCMLSVLRFSLVPPVFAHPSTTQLQPSAQPSASRPRHERCAKNAWPVRANGSGPWSLAASV